jgi:hypothetical protein
MEGYMEGAVHSGKRGTAEVFTLFVVISKTASNRELNVVWLNGMNRK